MGIRSPHRIRGFTAYEMIPLCFLVGTLCISYGVAKKHDLDYGTVLLKRLAIWGTYLAVFVVISFVLGKVKRRLGELRGKTVWFLNKRGASDEWTWFLWLVLALFGSYLILWPIVDSVLMRLVVGTLTWSGNFAVYLWWVLKHNKDTD